MAFGDDVCEKLKFVLGQLEKHCGKRRKCWLPAFPPFPTTEASFSGSLTVVAVWQGVKRRGSGYK